MEASFDKLLVAFDGLEKSLVSYPTTVTAGMVQFYKWNSRFHTKVGRSVVSTGSVRRGCRPTSHVMVDIILKPWNTDDGSCYVARRGRNQPSLQSVSETQLECLNAFDLALWRA